MDMTKVTATQFKARLGKYVQAVRAGGAVLITDRGVPVARLEAVEPQRTASQHANADERPAEVRARRGPALGDLKVRAIAHRGTDSLAMLRADRRR